MDYEGLSVPLTFGSCDERQCIDVTIENDNNIGSNEFFSVSLQRTTNLDSRIALNPNSLRILVCGYIHR